MLLFMIRFIFLLSILTLATTLSTIPVFKPSTKYVETGSATFNTAGYLNNASKISITQVNYSISLITPRNTTYSSFFSFEQFSFKISPTHLLYFAFARCGYSTTAMVACLQSKNFNSLQTLVVRHMVLDSSFTKFWIYLGFGANSGTTVSSSSPYFVDFTPHTTNFTGTINSWVLISGFNVSTYDTTANTFDFKVSATLVSSSIFRITVSTTSTKSLNLMGINVIKCEYNVGDALLWPFPAARLNYQAFSATTGLIATYLDTNMVALSSNTFWGINRFYITGQTFLEWSTTFTPLTSITGTSSSPFNNLAFGGFTWEFKQCDSTTPYYMNSQDVCYDICPSRYYEQTTTMTCQTCAKYYCYKCNSSTAAASCTSCNATLDFRTLVSGVCQPLPGYYDTGNSTAQPCNSNCLTCSGTSTLCTSCATQYFLNSSSKVCKPCSTGCSTCTSNTTCTLCLSPFTLASGSCTINCSLVANCATCNSGAGCTVCNTGYVVLNNTYCLVNPICGDGITEIGETCDDHNVNNGDGCSSTCLVELTYYCSSASPSFCQHCSLYCSTCTNSITCSNCTYALAPLDNVTSTCLVDCSSILKCSTCTLNAIVALVCSSCSSGYSPNAVGSVCDAICGDGVYISAVQSCDDGNVLGGDGCSPTCSVQAGFYCAAGSPSICQVCMHLCLACTLATDCSTCSAVALWNKTSSTCYLDCSPIPNCKLCDDNGTLFCVTCTSGYVPTLSKSSCVSFCGDGIIITASEGCDDKNIIDGDGCSSTCTIQSSYFCSGIPSVCSPCMPLCLACNSSLDCTTCKSIAPWNNSSNTCYLDCSSIPNCVKCDNNGTLFCLSCTLGYKPDSSQLSCLLVCGDGINIAPEACDDNNTVNGDGCSSTCTIQSAYFCLGAPSSCSACMMYCNNCTSASDCSLCQTLAPWSGTSLNCSVNCPISNCISCLLLSNNTSVGCQTCDAGYTPSIDSLSCIVFCGDSLIVGSETCDDGNAVSGDGCSALCLIEDAHYCAGVPSVCIPCSQYCFSCTSSSDCLSCHPLAPWNSTSLTCSPDCSVMKDCTSCAIDSNVTVICLTCLIGSSLDFNGISCDIICGDNIIAVPDQTCDDGGVLSGDGCSNLCLIETGYFCTGAPSTCSQCMQNCNNCSMATDCSLCFIVTVWNGATSSCNPDCSKIASCTSCSVIDQTTLHCDICMTGSTLSPDFLTCSSKCGDGIVGVGQLCDDGNNLSGDGCSLSCTVEEYFACNGTTPTSKSICVLTQMTIIKDCLIKLPGQNAAILTFDIFPAGLPSLSSLNWLSLIVPPNDLDGTIESAVYNPETNKVELKISYNSDISNNSMEFTFNMSAAGNQFSLLTNTTSTVLMSSDNNQSLVFYPDYTLSKVASYVGTGLGVLALLFMIFGLFGGKLIGLETAAVIQISYLSLMGLDEMSPTFSALQSLGLSCGFHKLQTYNMSQQINKPFKGLEIDLQYIKNFNIMFAMILLPLLVALISKILSKTCLKSRSNLLDAISSYSIWQFTFYGLMFNSYIIFTSLTIDFLFFSNLNQIQKITGFAIGGCLLIMGAIYAVCFVKRPDLFWIVQSQV